MTADLTLVERLVRRAYELGRVKRAVTLMIPWTLLGVLALWFGPFRDFDVVLAVLLTLACLAYLWRGQLAEQALLPGVKAGLIPLGLALVANAPGSHCAHEQGIVSLCTLACAV